MSIVLVYVICPSSCSHVKLPSFLIMHAHLPFYVLNNNSRFPCHSSMIKVKKNVQMLFTLSSVEDIVSTTECLFFDVSKLILNEILMLLFVAMGFDDETFVCDGIEEHICYT